MGFVKDVANVATFGLAGQLLKNKKKKSSTSVEPLPRPTMISTTPYERPISMITSRRD